MIWKALGQAAISSFGAGAGKAAMEHVLQGGRGKAGLLDGLESACLDNKRDRERVIRSLERKMGRRHSLRIREVVENHESLCLDDEQDRHTLISAIVAGGRRGRRASGRRAAEDVGLYELPPQTQKSIAGLIKYSFKDLSHPELLARRLTTKEKKIVGSVSNLGWIYEWANGTLGIPLPAPVEKRLANLINYSFKDIRGFGGLTAQEKKIVGSSANFTRIEKWANSPMWSKGGSSARGRRASGHRGTLVLKKTIGPMKVYFDREWEEYIVKPPGSTEKEWYRTDDKDDAFDTAQVMAQEHGHSARGRRARYDPDKDEERGALADARRRASFKYKIFEGYDHYKGRPLYQVTGVNNDYVGEWHTLKKDAQAELRGLTKTGHSARGRRADYPPVSQALGEVYVQKRAHPRAFYSVDGRSGKFTVKATVSQKSDGWHWEVRLHGRKIGWGKEATQYQAFEGVEDTLRHNLPVAGSSARGRRASGRRAPHWTWHPEKFRHTGLDRKISAEWPDNPLPELVEITTATKLRSRLKKAPGGLTLVGERKVGGSQAFEVSLPGGPYGLLIKRPTGSSARGRRASGRRAFGDLPSKSRFWLDRTDNRYNRILLFPSAVSVATVKKAILTTSGPTYRGGDSLQIVGGEWVDKFETYTPQGGKGVELVSYNGAGVEIDRFATKHPTGRSQRKGSSVRGRRNVRSQHVSEKEFDSAIRKANTWAGKYNRAVAAALKEHGSHGSAISGVVRDHFPRKVKEDLRSYLRRYHAAQDHIEALWKKRHPRMSFHKGPYLNRMTKAGHYGLGRKKAARGRRASGRRAGREINPYSKRYTFAQFKQRYFKSGPVPNAVAKEFWSDFRYAFQGGLQKYIDATTGQAARGRRNCVCD